jgi:hypothetical protein
MTTTKGKTRTQIAATAREREAKALDLRLLGYAYERIARELGYAHRSAARKAVDRALKAIPREAALQLREIELERLDLLQRSLASQIVRGHLPSIDSMLRIMHHRARLLGLYEPQPDSGIAEVAAVLGSWLGKVREVDALEGDLRDQDAVTFQDPLEGENARQTRAGGI